MTKNQFFTNLEWLLKQEAGSIKGTESLADFPGWDSLASVDFVMFAESELGEAISPDTLAVCRSVQDLVDLFPGKIK